MGEPPMPHCHIWYRFNSPFMDAVIPSLGRDLAASMRDLLLRCLRFDSTSGQEAEFTRFLAGWGKSCGFSVDLWESCENELADYGLSLARHIPLQGRPTAVITLPGSGGGRSLLFNAHTDVVAAPEPLRWRFGPFEGGEAEGKVYGRGACDVKGPLISALWAMLELKQRFPSGLDGDVSIELVPGEEDCVGLGTLTSLVRGHRADGLIVLEPTENRPCAASRGGCRFEITCHGQAVHGTVKWLGKDAIAALRHVMDAVSELESDWNDRAADPLFAAYPIARPMTIDAIRGGQWQGMLCDKASCSGYLELLPGDDLAACQARFRKELLAKLFGKGQDTSDILVAFTEAYPGHRCDPDGDFGKTARVVANSSLSAFNSGCEAGLRAGLEGTPTLVWGPGSLAQAHAVDEYVEWSQVEAGAHLFADFATKWCKKQ